MLAPPGKPQAFEQVAAFIQDPRSRLRRQVNLVAPFRMQMNMVEQPYQRRMSMQETISFKVDEEHRRLIKSAAEQMGMTPGQYCRFKAIQDAGITDLENKIDATREELQHVKSEIIKESRELVRTLSSYLITHLKK